PIIPVASTPKYLAIIILRIILTSNKITRTLLNKVASFAMVLYDFKYPLKSIYFLNNKILLFYGQRRIQRNTYNLFVYQFTHRKRQLFIINHCFLFMRRNRIMNQCLNTVF